MPVYNVEAFVEDAIRSILKQSFKDFELLVINDGSTDKSVTIVENLAKEDSRIKIFHQENGGLSSARNVGLKNAIGTYVYFIDSDDSLRWDALEHIYLIFSKYDVDMVAFTASTYIDQLYPPADVSNAEVNADYFLRSYLDEGIYDGYEYFKTTTETQDFVVSACLYVVPLKLVKTNSLLFHEGIIHEDEIFTRELIMECKKVYLLKEPFYERRLRFNSITNSIESIHRPYSFLIISEQLEKLYKKCGKSLIQERSFYFYQLAIKTLNSYRTKPLGYNKIVSQIFNSPLSNIYKINFSTKMRLRFKEINIFQSFCGSMRYRIALRTRLKKIFSKL